MRVTIVIPMWNQLELTLRCLRSLMELSSPPASVVIVDNASEPDPRVELEGAGVRVTVLRQAQNLGFAGGCNAGIRHALADGGEAILLLNNDAVAHPDLIDELAAGLADGDRVAACGGKTLTDETPPRIHAAYSVLTFNAPLVRVEGWLEPQTERFGEACDVDSVSGGAMMLNADALRDVGLFDEELFAYHEDVEWCMRARARGWRIRYRPNAVVYHRMHASTGGGYESPIVYLSARNAVRVVRRHGTAAQRLHFAAFTLASLVRELPYRLRHGQQRGYRLRLRGLWDGLVGRPVPLEELGLRPRANVEL